jgi:threonine dehydrogenase-like Zn-dependent dehydrogenase
MRAAILGAARHVRVEHVPRPVPGEGEALIDIRASGICGSDLHRYLGRDPWGGAAVFPRRVGHEIAGIVSALGTRTRGIAIGQAVGVEPMQLAGCGHCMPCRIGASNLCVNRAAVQPRRTSSGLAEFDLAHVHHLHPLPEKMQFEEAALADVYACAIHALHRVPVAPGMTALVIGTGALGLALGQIIRNHGASAILIGRHKRILTSALAIGAADRVVLHSGDEALEQIADATDRKDADVAFECAGGTSSATVTLAVELVVPRGRIGILGAFTGDVGIPYGIANRKEITVTFCNGYATWEGQREFQLALDLIGSGSVDARALVTHRFPLVDVAEAFRTAADKARSGAIKVMVTASTGEASR